MWRENGLQRIRFPQESVTTVVLAISGLSTGYAQMMPFKLPRAMDRDRIGAILAYAYRVLVHYLGKRRDEDYDCRFVRPVY